jgi:hypothetical protein
MRASPTLLTAGGSGKARAGSVKAPPWRAAAILCVSDYFHFAAIA